MTQNTIIYIDAANILLSAHVLGLEVQMPLLVKHLQDTYRGCTIVYFTGNFSRLTELFQHLEQAHVEIVRKEVYKEDAHTKANCDVEIAHRITHDVLLHPPEQIVLLSGDGDFACMLDFMQQKGIRCKVIATDPKSCSRMLKRRLFARISYLVEEGAQLFTQRNEKPPATT